MAFDPESDAYDMASALAAGLKADETGHWPSRDPRTGLLLKGRKHKTWPLTLEGEEAAGMEIYQQGNRWYSRPKGDKMADVSVWPFIPDPMIPGTPLPPPSQPSFTGVMNPATAMPAPSAQPGGGMSGVMNPVPQEVQAMHKPTADPVEIEARKAGWMDVVRKMTSDPNVMRAVGYFGSSLAQPMPFGQTRMGHLAQAFGVGRSAYDFGKEAEFQRQMLMKKEGREEAESGALVRSRHATAAGQEQQNEITALTKDDAIAKLKLETERAREQLAGTKDENRRKKLETDAIARREAIIASLPEGVEKRAVIAEMQKPEYDLKRIQAATASSNAAAGASSAQAALSRAKLTEQDLENQDNALLTPEERRAQRNRRGATSGQVQAAEWFRSNYKVANPGATDQAAAAATAEWLKDKKTDDMEQFMKFQENRIPKPGETPQQVFQEFLTLKEIVKGGGNTAPAAGNTPAGAATGTTASKPAPAVGTIIRGYKFKGGNPADPNNWERATR